MSKYEFKYTQNDNCKISMEIDEVHWPTIIEYFIYFLRGCGFNIKDGEFIESEDDE